ERPLGPGTAQGARPPFEVEPDLLGPGEGICDALGDRHAASYPASWIAARTRASETSVPPTFTSFVSRSTSTDSTPGTSDTSSSIDCAQCEQWIAGTVYVSVSLMRAVYPAGVLPGSD